MVILQELQKLAKGRRDGWRSYANSMKENPLEAKGHSPGQEIRQPDVPIRLIW